VLHGGDFPSENPQEKPQSMLHGEDFPRESLGKSSKGCSTVVIFRVKIRVKSRKRGRNLGSTQIFFVSVNTNIFRHKIILKKNVKKLKCFFVLHRSFSTPTQRVEFQVV
jgi:hypothetical protein